MTPEEATTMTRDDARARGGRLKTDEEDTRYSSASKGTTTGSPRSQSDGAAALHTPGPWETHVGHDATGYPCFFIHGMSGDEKRDTARLHANAHLIAAAPDLLAVCKEAQPLIEEWLQGVPELAERMAAAIAKADGRPAPTQDRP